MIRHGFPGEQLNHVRHSAADSPSSRDKHVDHAAARSRDRRLTMSRTSGSIEQRVAPSASQSARSGGPAACAPEGVRSERPRRPIRVCRRLHFARAIDQAVLEAADIAAVQPAGHDDRGGREQRVPSDKDGRRLRGRNRAGARGGRARRQPRRRGDRTPTSINDFAARFSAAGIGV